MFRKDRDFNEKTKGGGVLLYIKSHLNAVEICENKNTETVWINLHITKEKEITIGVCYRTPSISNQNENILFDTIKRMTKKSCIVMGDFNFPDIDWCQLVARAKGEEFLDLTLDSYLHQNVTKPTRGENILDLVGLLSSDKDLVSELEIHCPVANSDHNVICWQMRYDKNINSKRKLSDKSYNYDKGKYIIMNERLSTFDWKNILSDTDIESCWSLFCDKLLELREELVPVRKTSNKKDSPFINDKIKRKIKKRNKRWAEYCKNPTLFKELQYKVVRNEVVSCIRLEKKVFESKIADKIKTDSKKFYAYVNSKRICKEKIGPLKNEEGKLEHNPLILATILNQYFASVFTREILIENDLYREEDDDINFITLNDIDITRTKVVKALQELKRNKSGGIDSINSTLLIECKTGVTSPLEQLFSASINLEKIPDEWRLANVTPIFKKGSKKEPGNYRPVSLTSHVCKVLEKIIKEDIVNFLEQNNRILESQHGFRNKRSCLTNLLEFTENLLESVDEKDPVDVFFLDLQKAFDKVPHNKLIYKVHKIGIRGKVLNWIQNWLKGRKQRVVLDGEKSDWAEVTSGVPQGSVLGPLLFIIYINDLDENIRNRFWKFADDSKMLEKVKTSEDINIIKKDLEEIINWSDRWQMPFNIQKCKVMHIGKSNPKIDYEIKGEKIQEVTQETDLGIEIKNNLKVDAQCIKASKKGNQILGLIARTFECKDKRIILKLYKSLVRPQLDYCIQAWRPHLHKDIDILEKVQKRATRMIEGFKGLGYEIRLKKLHLTTLETRRARADLIEVYKIIRGLEGLRSEDFFEMKHERNTRGHMYKIFKKSFRTNFGKYSFGNRVIEEWNLLPAGVVSADNINKFKNMLDHHLEQVRGFN